MTRYFFNTLDAPDADSEGVELETTEQAVSAALVLAGELIREMPLNAGRPPWVLVVTNECGARVLELNLQARYGTDQASG